MSLTFKIAKGQKYTITIKPVDAADAPGDLVSGPVLVSSDPTVYAPGPVRAVGDTLVSEAIGLKKGVVNVKIDAVGAGPLHEEADGTVTNPLASKLLVTGAVSSGG